MVEPGNNPLASVRGAAAPGVSWETAADLRAGGQKAVAESLPWGGGEEESGVGAAHGTGGTQVGQILTGDGVEERAGQTMMKAWVCEEDGARVS